MTYEEFMTLIQAAYKETRFISGREQRNANVRKIIDSADKNTIPFACLILKDYTHLAFAILYELVPAYLGRPPIPDYYKGHIPVIKECWKYWALQNKHVFSKHSPTAYWVEDKFGHRGEWH